MLVALAVVHGRQRIDGKLRRQFLQRMAEQQVVDKGVRGERKMVAVLFDRGGGQHQQRRLARKRVDLLPVQVREVTQRRGSRYS